jgi:hypothetical protein
MASLGRAIVRQMTMCAERKSDHMDIAMNQAGGCWGNRIKSEKTRACDPMNNRLSEEIATSRSKPFKSNFFMTTLRRVSHRCQGVKPKKRIREWEHGGSQMETRGVELN